MDIGRSEAAITRVLGTILLEQNHAWSVQRGRYMTLEMTARFGGKAVVSLPAAAFRHPPAKPPENALDRLRFPGGCIRVPIGRSRTVTLLG